MARTEFHFVVYGYTDVDGRVRFSVEEDDGSYFPDGSVWDGTAWRSLDVEKDSSEVETIIRELMRRLKVGE